jgi:hypothetical protein
MEFAIPISRFDPSRVRWGEPRSGPFRKTIPFGYDENQLVLNNLILILQPLRVVELDWTRNQLVLEESRNKPFLSKLEQFQSIVSSELEKQCKYWLDETKVGPTNGTTPLQPWLKSKKLTLYLSAQPDTLNYYTDKGPTIFSDLTIKPGDIIRAVIKIQGLSLQMSEGDIWTGKSRIQHHILQLYKVTMPIEC